jgi:hypothetical protein
MLMYVFNYYYNFVRNSRGLGAFFLPGRHVHVHVACGILLQLGKCRHEPVLFPYSKQHIRQSAALEPLGV